jgi:hypothetical protein
MGTRSSWSPAADRRRVPGLAAALVLALMAAGCTGGGTHPGPPGASTPSAAPVASGPSWAAVDLPASGTGRPVVRDVAACSGRWYAAGGYATADGGTRPGLWTSVNARAWSEVPLAPVSAYGPTQLLTSVSCGSAAVVAIGSTSGGVHGNARVSTWAGSPGGALTEQPAPFELFGGPDAIGVGKLAASLPGAPGFLIVGAWRDANGQAGAAVWVSGGDGRAFRLVNADAELESDARGATEAHDAVARPGGFTLVGSVGTPGSRVSARDPAVWTSSDGLAWRRAPVPVAAENEELQRVLAVPGGELAVGVRGDGFGAWRGSATGDGWRAAGRFGSFAGSGLPAVTGLVTGPGGDAYAVVGDGSRYRLWSGTDGTSWTERALPAAVPVGEQRTVVVAGAGGRLLLAAEDGTSSRLWLAG